MASLVSGWPTSVFLNLSIAIAFAAISYTALSGLIATRQVRSNTLGVATAAIFASCAFSHAVHGLHMVLPELGIDAANGLAMREAIDWHLNAADTVTAGVAVWYWTLRPKFAELLDGGLLFSDLQKRFDHQSRALDSKGRLADTLQRALAPTDLPTTTAVAFDAFYLPADDAISVGGDWYDVFTLPGGRTAFSIGDVTGHGAEAAAITSRAREAIAAAAFASDDPALVLRRANEILCERKTAIVTAIFGVVDARGRELRYATAGHPPPIVADRDGQAAFGAYDGLALSIDPEAAYRTFVLPLEHGTAVVFYTDGVTEFDRNLGDGNRRLLAAVSHHARLRTASPAKPITRETLGTSRPRDDIAVLVVKMLGDPVVVDTPYARHWAFDVKDSQAAMRLRHEVMACVAARAPQTSAFETELILGELLGNVVKHTPGVTDVELDWRAASPVLRVQDKGSRFSSSSALPEDDYSENGRGMFLINALSKHVEIRRLGEVGNEVCITLPVTQTVAAAADLGADRTTRVR